MSRKHQKKQRNVQRAADQNGSRRNPANLLLSYDFNERNEILRPRPVSTKSEDREFQPSMRQKLISDARNQLRNFSLAGFLVRKHLQNIAFYQFNAGTSDKEFNAELDRRLRNWKRRQNCDVARRHSFDGLINLIEYHRAVDGDLGILKLRNGRIQLIEGDRINNPPFPEHLDDWVHGVKLDRFGQTLEYSISKRKEYGGFEHERTVAADKMFLLGYMNRIDQVRGVSLLAPAILMFSYLYETLDLALAKMKLEQTIGFKTILSDGGINQPIKNDNRNEEFKNRVEKMFYGRVVHLGLRDGENAEFMESNNPSQNFQAFCESVIRMIFASFDIPFSFYDGSKTNFYGSEGEYEQYVDSIERKQQPTIDMLNEMMFDWLLPFWVSDPIDPLVLPAGWTIDDLRGDCSWSGAGMPSWRMFRRVKEMTAAVQSGFISPSYLANEYGFDMRKNIDDLAVIKNYSDEKGVPLTICADTKVNLGM